MGDPARAPKRLKPLSFRGSRALGGGRSETSRPSPALPAAYPDGLAAQGILPFLCCSLSPTSLLPALIWGSRDGAGGHPLRLRVGPPPGRSWPSFWVVAVCLPILSPGWELWGKPTSPGLGMGRALTVDLTPPASLHGDRLTPDCPSRQKTGAQTCCRCSRFTVATRS